MPQFKAMSEKSLNWLKKSQSTLQIIFINLVILGFLIEGISTVFYWLKFNQIYYTRHREEASQNQGNIEILNQTGIRLEESINERLHPFLGYIYKPGVIFRGFEFQTEIAGNNYGFASPHNYPLIKQNENQVIVGVFGGSVASHYATQELEENVLIPALKQLPDYRQKEIIVLNFAQGGYKQPQQLLALSYFMSLGQKFDIVINIDGFNEVALANVNAQENVEIAMPSAQHVLPLASLATNRFSRKELASALKIQTYKDQLRQGLDAIETCRLASCYTYYFTRNQILVRQYQKELQVFDANRTTPTTDSNSLIYINTRNSQSVDFQQMAQLWATASIQMKQLVEGQGGRYFQFLQPNQYLTTQRRLTPEEQNTAIRPDHPYAPGVKQGYPQLLQQSDRLKQNGVNFFNALTVLDAEPSTVYIDDCCHYNRLGRRIFANYIAQSIVQTLK